jgi:hypothetical protein
MRISRQKEPTIEQRITALEIGLQDCIFNCEQYRVALELLKRKMKEKCYVESTTRKSFRNSL